MIKKRSDSKIWLILFFLLCAEVAFCQPIVPRSNSSITVQDSRYKPQYNLFIPAFADTTAANVQKGIDSLGAIIYTYDVQNIWIRRYSSGKKWEAVGSGSGGSGTVTNVATGLGLSGGPITTTGTILVDTASASILSRQRAAATYQPIGSYVTGNIYTVDDALDGDRTVDFGGNFLKLQQGGNNFLELDPTSGSELAILRAYNTTDGDNYGHFYAATSNTAISVQMLASFNGGAGEAYITALASNVGTSLSYLADTHSFEGTVTLADLAGNGAGVVAVDNDGLLSWLATPGGVGTVTSVAQSFTGGLISVAGSPVTTSGTLALTVAGTSGGGVYFSSTSAWASTALLAANSIMIGGGAGAAYSTTTTGTGVLTALGINVGSAGAFVTFNGAGGTPSAITLTNGTGLPISGITGLGSGVGTWLATPSSANLSTALTDETGSGLAVFGTAPSMASITLAAGTATAATAPIYFTSGTNLTVPVSGAKEFDGTTFYNTTASGRGVAPSTMIARIITGAEFTMQNINTVQPVFPTGADVWTLQGSTTYYFEGFYYFTHGTTSHNILTSFELGGGASVTSIFYTTLVWTTAAQAQTSAQATTQVSSATAIAIVAAASVGQENVKFSGYISMNAGGTVTPSITFSADPTGTILAKAGTYITFTPVGTNTFTTVGNVN